MAKVKINRIGILSLGKISGILYFILGLIADIAFLLIPGFGFSLIFVIIFPILYGIMGLVIGVVMAFLYNLIAERFGGLEIETKK